MCRLTRTYIEGRQEIREERQHRRSATQLRRQRVFEGDISGQWRFAQIFSLDGTKIGLNDLDI
jgi:cytidylate kinase